MSVELSQREDEVLHAIASGDLRRGMHVVLPALEVQGLAAQSSSGAWLLTLAGAQLLQHPELAASA